MIQGDHSLFSRGTVKTSEKELNARGHKQTQH